MDEKGGVLSGAGQANSTLSILADQEPVPANEPVGMRDGQTSLGLAEAGPFIDPFNNGQIRTLDGDIAGDEFASDAINYQVLLRKIDALLERLGLDA